MRFALSLACLIGAVALSEGVTSLYYTRITAEFAKE